MSHEWILDVLRDLRAYARANGFPALARQAEEALGVAEAEIRDATLTPPQGAGGGVGPSGKAH